MNNLSTSRILRMLTWSVPTRFIRHVLLADSFFNMFARFRVLRLLQHTQSARTGRFCSKVPDKPTWIPVDTTKLPQVEEISRELVEHLERLSLVEFSNEEGLQRLSAAIHSANKLYMVNTDGVEPLDSVLEDRPLYLRKDAETEGSCRGDVLKNASKTEEEYYVAPPGNIPLKQAEKEYKEKLQQKNPVSEL